jgi:glycerophosphoryl diester phosphodiesterase
MSGEARAWARAMLATILAAIALVTPVASTGQGPIAVAAHRGGSLLWPENSLLAHRNAIGLGVDYLETDVHLSADGELIVLHDPTLERTTTGRGAVRDVRAADLAGVRLKAADGTVTAEPVPTLAQLLELLEPSRVRLLLEIKVDANRQRYPGIEEKTLALVKQRGLLDRVVIMAFEAPTILRVRELEPSARTTLLVSRTRVERERVAPREAVRWAKAARATDLGIDFRALDGDVIADSRAAGLRVAAWTVNEETDIRRVLALGVDVLISDRPDLARRLAAAPR